MTRAGLLSILVLCIACGGSPGTGRSSTGAVAPARRGSRTWPPPAAWRSCIARATTARYLLPEIMGGGAALFDMDGDGDLDLLAGAERQDGARRRGRRPAIGSTRTAAAAPSPMSPTTRGVAAVAGYGMGAATADYDNDGDVDVYVTGLGSNVLLQNDGRGQFLDVTGKAGVVGSGWSTSATFADIDGDAVPRPLRHALSGLGAGPGARVLQPHRPGGLLQPEELRRTDHRPAVPQQRQRHVHRHLPGRRHCARPSATASASSPTT